MRALIAIAVLAAACGSELQSSDTEQSTLFGDALIARAIEVKRGADAFGINGLLVAGIGYHESGLQQCWSEATWSCPGPYSYDCDGPVLTGAYDGPCSWEQGGIGMFQLDSGTYADTLAEHGDSVLEVAGNAQAGAGFIAYKVRICPNTPVFESDQEVIDWINSALPGTDRFEEFLTAMAWCYNGCAPSFTGCSHSGMRENYRNGVQGMIDLLGWEFWTAPLTTTPTCAASR